MRNISVGQIIETIEILCQKAANDLGTDVEELLRQGLDREESPLGQHILEQIMENAALARQKNMPICQDTGLTVVFAEIGQDVHITGGSLPEAINEGVRRGYTNGYLRKSVVADPLFGRKNTGDNTPAIIHTEIVPGDKLRLVVVPKGAGSENMGALKMLTPAEGISGVKEFVLDTVIRAGGNPCPPVIVGVGIGGNMEKAVLLAKKALLRKAGSSNPDKNYAALERELLNEINKTGIGPQGLGGRITALAVHIESFSTHIATLPVAVNLNCHASRHAEAVI